MVPAQDMELAVVGLWLELERSWRSDMSPG